MQYVPFGATGIKVSELCYGTMSFGGDADEDEAARLYAACRTAGINFFDTANVYNDGRSETILGRLIAGERDELVISSKAHMPTSADVNDRGLEPAQFGAQRGAEPQAPRHRPARCLFCSQMGPGHAGRGDPQGARKARRRRQGHLSGGIEFRPPGRSPRRSVCPTSAAGRASMCCSRCTISSSARSRPRSCRWPRPKNWRSCPIRRSEVGC